METTTIYVMSAASLVFFAAGIYLHVKRKSAMNVYPEPFVNPPTRRKKRKKSRLSSSLRQLNFCFLI